MKTIKKAAISGLLAVATISCKKEVKLLSTKDALSHSWKLTLQGSDLNGNMNFDTEEKNVVPDSARYSYQLKNSGSGFRVGPNNIYVDSVRWELINGESLLYISLDDKGFKKDYYYKYQVGSKTLIVLDTTATPDFYRYFERED